LLGDLLQGGVLGVDHDRDPGDLGVLGLADRERVDVEAATGEHAGHPGQDAGLVLHQHRQRVLAHVFTPVSEWWVAKSTIAAACSGVVPSSGRAASAAPISSEISVQPRTTACAPRATRSATIRRYAWREPSRTTPRH